MRSGVSMEYDMLKEAFCQSAKEASDHIKEMMQMKEDIVFSLPVIQSVSTLDLMKKNSTATNEMCWMLVFDIKAFTGFAEVTFHDNTALRIVSSMLNVEMDAETIQQEKNDVIAEVVNVMINCYLVYLAPVFGKKLSGSVPTFQFNDIAKALHLQKPDQDHFSWLESSFHIAGRDIRGSIAIVLQD